MTTYSMEISITQIAKDLEKVKAKKAPGPDGISSKVLSLNKSYAADGLFTVFHKSSRTRTGAAGVSRVISLSSSFDYLSIS